MAMSLYILLSMTAVNHVLGASLSISGSSSYAVLNQPFTLTCTVTQAAGLSGVILFSTKTTDTFASLGQSGGSCAVFNPPLVPGYSVSCGSGTDSSSSSTKKYHLRINRAAERDVTDWWCILSSAGTRSNTLRLKLSSGPDSVTLNPSSPGSVAEGDSLTVTCAATGCNPPCSNSWTLGNQRILANLSVKTDKHQQESDRECSTSVTVDELTPMTLKCYVTSNPGSDIKLLNNSQTLREVTNSKQAEYTWNEAGCLDTGHYRCEAGNNIKSAVSESVQLVVTCSPRLDHRVPFQKQFTAAEGGDVTLKISVIANPTPTFTWYKLTDGNKNRLGFGSSSTTDVSAVGNLTLATVQQGDIGTYQVVVSNGAKNSDLVVNLTLDVAGPPDVPPDVTAWGNGPHSITVAWVEEFNGGSSQTFTVQYRADTSQWTNLTGVIPEKGRNTIQKAFIPNLQPKRRYLMRVLAYNKYGYKGFTDEQEALTLDESLLPASSNKLSGEGIAVGIIIGIAVSALVVAVFVILWRRGLVCVSSKS
ncbi:nephrin-like, partial [Gigantopelta aegis]|uniref:nephrin-like n=1 Tax=Gigantopelta aegis TaxID=1735272 RepID=UPI001B88AD0A